jgi:hypothetical protein
MKEEFHLLRYEAIEYHIPNTETTSSTVLYQK